MAAELALHNLGIQAYEQAKKLPTEQLRQTVRSHPHPIPASVLSLAESSGSSWMARWRSVGRLQLAGSIRSFLFKLQHRRLPLLSLRWLAEFYDRPQHCILCASDQPETYSHLFSDCELATRACSEIQPTSDVFQQHPSHDDLRPARVLGDTDSFTIHHLQQA